MVLEIADYIIHQEPSIFMNQILSLQEMMDFIMFHWNFLVFNFSQLLIAINHIFHFSNICHGIQFKPILKPQMAAFWVCLLNICFSLIWRPLAFQHPSVCLIWCIQARPSDMVPTGQRKIGCIFTRIISLLSLCITQAIGHTLFSAYVTFKKTICSFTKAITLLAVGVNLQKARQQIDADHKEKKTSSTAGENANA